MIEKQLERLSKSASYVSPYLKHITTESDSLQPCNTAQAFEQLYMNIATRHPEAGQAYWLARTWNLLTWQPVFLSFIAIYTQKMLPDLAKIEQYQSECFVSGYKFQTSKWYEFSHSNLIKNAARQLLDLFEDYRRAINQWGRIRPGFTHHLLADQVLNCVVRLQEYCPNYSNQMIFDQAKLWLAELKLPEKHLDGLMVDQDTNKVTFIRTSCCLVYKCNGARVCSNCPRLEQNKMKLNCANKNTEV